MKKVLLASTALLLTAGFASAQSIELSGSADAGLKYDADDAGQEVTIDHSVTMTISGSGASDVGLEFGAFVDVEDGDIGDAEVFISGLFGTVSVGDVSVATNGFGIADVGYDGIGVDNPAEQYKNATADADIRYTYSAAGLTFIASAEVGEFESYAAAVEYSAQGFSGGIGYVTSIDNALAGTNSTWTVGAGFSQGAVSINAVYSDWDGGTTAGGQGYGVDVSFDAAGATITAAYSNASGVSAGKGLGDSYGIGFAVPLGGGLSVAGGIGSVQRDVDAGDTGSLGARTVADLGLTMSF